MQQHELTLAADAAPLNPLTLKFIDLLALAFRYAVPWIALCVLVYLFSRTIASAAAAADTHPLIMLMSNVTRTRASAFIFGFLGVLYGIQQRDLRRAAELRLKRRIAVLEQELAAVRPAAFR